MTKHSSRPQFRKDARWAIDQLVKRINRDGRERDQVVEARVRQWLAPQLGLTIEQCLVGLMDEATCRRVIALCRAAPPQLPAIKSGEN